MKKIAIVALAAAATFITSCDIERMPYDKYTEDKIMEDKDAAVDVLLNGCYAKLKTASEHLHYCGEFPGDNVCKDKPTTNPFGTYFTYQHTVNNGGLSTVWNSAYNIISQTSSLMKMINENESPELNQKLGEAYYMRGMMYFYLCRVFGRPYYQEPEKNLGVPIVNGMPEDMDNLDLPDRSSVKDTYEQVLSDLKKAEELMSDFKSPAYASKYAAQALLAKVYMYMSGTFENPNKEYAQLSYNYANEVIESNQFSLLSRSTFMTYNELAPDAASQTETIFAVKFIASDWDETVGFQSIPDEEQMRDICSQVKEYLETTNAFLRKDLSLSILSRETGIYQKLLSRSINEYLKQNFFELINEMRVGEAKRRLLLPENAGHTVDSLYEECGFRTRSTFFLAFKKVEGLSPAQWLNSVKKHTDQ